MAKGVVPSKKIQVEEIIKCGKDPIYFIKHYVYIQHPVRGAVKFDTYPFQDDCVKDFLEHRFNIVAKSRQLGLSTITAAYCLWLALFYKNKNVLIIATKMLTAKGFVQKVQYMFKSLPTWLVLPKVEQHNLQSISFDNGSIIKAVPTNVDAGRGEALSLLIVDEAAHIENMQELWTGLYPTISAGGRCILLSSPAGVGNTFHKLWDESNKGLNEFNHIFLPWMVHPERNEEWFQKETKNLDARSIAQEYCASFEASGHAYLTTEDIMWVESLVRPPVDRIGPKYNCWIWKHPEGNKRYILSADVARGDAADFSTFHIIDVEEDEVVVEFRDKIPPDRFGEYLYEIGTMYNNALIVIEKNTYGIMSGNELKKLKYENLYYEKYTKDIFSINYIPNEEEVYPGLTTTGKNRAQILAKFEEIIRNKKVRVHSSRLNEELKTFVISNGRPQAMKSYNDDLILSLAIGFWIYDVAEGHSKQSEGLGQALLAGMSKSETVFNSQGWTAGANGYDTPIMPMSFTKKHKQPGQKQMPTGPNSSYANVYHMYDWMFDKKS